MQQHGVGLQQPTDFKMRHNVIHYIGIGYPICRYYVVRTYYVSGCVHREKMELTWSHSSTSLLFVPESFIQIQI